MRIFVRNARITDPTSLHNGQELDLLIEDGIIAQLGKELDPTGADELIEGEGIHVSQGWIDLFATVGDPGLEHRETVASALDAAAGGGFTRMAVSPESFPVSDGKSGVEYLLGKAKGHTVQLIPLGAITKGLKGAEMAEMYDMVRAGAGGVSNGKHTVSDSKLMQVAMQYALDLGVPFYSYAEDVRMAAGSQMHEGEVSTVLGLKGVPALAEELAVARDLYLARYTGMPLHFSHITTAGAVQLIREAKAQGLPVTASVPAHHLLLIDANVETFDSNYKVRPPFRDSSHVDALWIGLLDGTLDAVCSDHEPLDREAKFMEFGQATPGIVALETLFPTLLKAAEGRCHLEGIIQMLTTGPRKVLGIERSPIAEGAKAELTLFSTDMEWNLGPQTSASLSANSPFFGKTLTGRAIAVIREGSIAFGKL